MEVVRVLQASVVASCHSSSLASKSLVVLPSVVIWSYSHDRSNPFAGHFCHLEPLNPSVSESASGHFSA